MVEFKKFYKWNQAYEQKYFERTGKKERKRSREIEKKEWDLEESI